MIVAILLSYLNQINKREHFRDVYLGVAAAFLLILGGGIAAYVAISDYKNSNFKTYFETVTYLVAAALLTGMTFWMHKHARTMTKELQTRSEVALTKGNRWGLRLLSFQSVGREGLETMVFTLAIVFASSKQSPTPLHGNLLLLGAVLGLVVSLAIAFGIYKLGMKLNFKRFFQVLGVVLMLFAAALLAAAVQNLQSLNWLPFGTHVLWNSSGTINENSNLGSVLHSFIGYADHPTVLQLIVWAGYLVISVTAFVRYGRKGSKTTKPLTS
jgi:high-affinity iron transporter